MNKKWMFALISVFAFVVLFFFFKWLYTPDTYGNAYLSAMGSSSGTSAESIEVFNFDIEKRLKLEEYSRNPSIQLLNTVITSAKTSYEMDYGCPMPGFFASTVSSMMDGLHTDIGNPITYLNLAFTAFSQYDPSALAYAGSKGSEAAGSLSPPNISSFDEAPQGAIYFSEEDEYKAEGVAAVQQPITPTEPQAYRIAESAVGMPGKIAIRKNSPLILIYHTHSTESYMPNTSGNYHTLNEKYSVISVGNVLVKELQDKYKYKVIHDKTKHDKESYAYSYANSLLTVKNNINKYKSLSVILDIHRDAFDAEKYSSAERTAKKNEYTASINGKKAAKIMLVIAKGNPNYAELEKFAVYIKQKMDKLYPGLFLRIDVKDRGKYNQYFSNHSMLVEVGCMLNTTEEAQYSGELLARVLGEVINDLKE